MAGPPAGAGAAAGAAAAGVRPGAVVRLEGLQQQPDLNGELCKVLRPAAEGRWIVATGRGEKSVKAEHLHSASAQLAVGTRRGLIAGTVATVVLVADLLRSSGQNPVSAALTPVFAVLWLLGTLACCYGLHRPLRDPGVWVPAISEMALAPPARVLYQYGFALVGGLFACTVRLYDVLLASPSRAAAAEGPAPAAAFLDRGAALGYLSAFGVVLQGVLERGEEVPNVEDLKEWWRTKVGRGFNVDRGDDSPDRGQEVWDITANNCHVTLEDLTKVCILGKGGYGQVILVKETAHQDRKYALKVLSKGHIEEQGAQRLVSWERELLSMIDSPFVIRLHRTFKDAQYVYFLLEAAMGGSLASVLNDVPEVFNEDSPRGWSMGFYAACITAALEHLHERRIVHRDLKPENVLLDEEGYAKVCDMGFARFVLSRTNTLAGTPDYMAPEMISFPHTHCCAVDWWALGVLCFELLAGQTPFQDEGICDPVGRLLAIRRSQERGICHYPYHFPSIAKPFVSHLLQNDPKDRLGAGPRGASEVRAEPIFRALKFDFDALHAQTLRSPYRKAWEEPRERDASGADCHNFGMDEDDSIFIKAGSTAVCAVGSFATWDAKF